MDKLGNEARDAPGSPTKDELMHSIKQQSGKFLQEFRELEEDPYKREEFIMSLGKRGGAAAASGAAAGKYQGIVVDLEQNDTGTEGK